jgi:poly(A) polymerase
MGASAEPRVIPRKEHGISRKQVSPNALRTLYRLHTHGFIAYLVGGCVRDLLLGRTPKDFDIGTNATPGQIRRLFRNCFLVGRRFRLAHLKFDDEIVQVSTFRRTALPSDNVEAEEEGQTKRRPWHLKNEDGMVLVDNVFGTPEEDALRRDFTINALAYNIADFSVIDYTTGLADLQQRLIRPIGDPRVRFTEDPVRMLRAVRFAASHGFAIEAAAWEIICELAGTISRASPARLYEEIQKLFLFGSARPAFSLLEKGGLIAGLFPGLGRWIYASIRHMELLEANLAYIDGLYRSGTPVSPALFIAALFGPATQETALAHHRDGIPFQQALDAACELFMKESCKIVTIPGRVGGRVRDILSLQASLHRMPPRRPASIVAKPAFGEALAYLRLGVELRKEHWGCLKWWDTFLLEPPPIAPPDSPTEKAPPAKKRRKKRRNRRRVRKTAA